MGYSYGLNTNGNWVLSCDNCGATGGVRKRTCPYKVVSDSSRGPRVALPYCPAPALCSACYKALGGLRGVHGDHCKDGAAQSRVHYDAVQARLDAGALMVLAAFGDWKDDVPEGMVGVVFGANGTRVYRLVPDESYDPSAKPFLDDYPEAITWDH